MYESAVQYRGMKCIYMYIHIYLLAALSYFTKFLCSSRKLIAGNEIRGNPDSSRVHQVEKANYFATILYLAILGHTLKARSQRQRRIEQEVRTYVCTYVGGGGGSDDDSGFANSHTETT